MRSGVLDPALPFLQRRVMRDADAERELSERGYTVIDLLDAAEVERLYRFYAAHADRGDLNPPGAHNEVYAEFTTMSSRTEFRRAAFDEIVDTVRARTDAHLVDLQPVVANFVNKVPEGGLVPVHQNMSVVDEEALRSVSVWIALVDCGAENGTLQLVDGSHLEFRGRRGVWAYQEFGLVGDDVIAEHFTSVDIRAGQAIVLDDATIHYSSPNRSSDRRLAIQLVMAPAEAQAIYYEQVGEHDDVLEIEVLAVEPEYFFDFWGGVGDRSHARVLDRIEVPRVHHDEQTFARMRATARPRVATPARQGWLARLRPSTRRSR